ncbi:hypothetical protein DL765_008331 [Monosporascus sp. GIB2]|nr:hypothetical protein DL765_008331 [Monosporascus sp. GIB2]
MAQFTTTNSKVGIQAANIDKVVVEGRNADNRCLADLRVTDPRDDKMRIEQTSGGLLKDSYKWILDHADFRRWHDDEDSRLLWIKGDAGKGKTMLLCGIIDELSQAAPGRISKAKKDNGVVNKLSHQFNRVFASPASPSSPSFFFCQGTDSQLNNATAVLRGLIYLLLLQQPSLILHIQERYDHAGRQLFEDRNAFYALSQTLVSMLRDRRAKGSCMIIDALDECETDLPKLLDFIVQTSTYPRVKWIVSSRNRHDIEQHLRLDDSRTRLSLELNAQHITQAIDIYIEHKVSHLVSLKGNKSLQNQVRDEMRLKADGTFLWVALVAQELQNVQSWNVLSALEQIPPGLMPLSFLTIRDDRVYLIHQSVKDYLNGKASSTIFPSGPTNVHHAIFSQSLQAMSATLRRDIYNLHHPGLLIGEIKAPDPDPLAAIRYSCVHWIDHFCDAYNRSCPEVETVGQFLQEKFLYWLEALGLIQHMGDAILSITRLESLLREQSTDRELLDLVQDSRRFILQNRWIVENAPLQTYASALIFSPAYCLIRKIFKDKEPKWIVPKPIVEHKWSPCLQTLEGHKDSVLSVAFSHDSKLLASGSDDWTIKIWDTATGSLQQTLEGHEDWVMSVAFSHNSKLLASGSNNGTINIWDTATGSLQQTLEGHKDWVLSVAFSHNSKLLASGSNNGTINIWDPATGSLQQTLEGHKDWVLSVVFSHNSKLLASGSKDKTIKIWDAATGSLQQTFDLGTLVRTMSFENTGLYLDTEIGRIDLAAGTKSIQSLFRTPHPDQAQEAQYYGYALSRDKSWITWNKHNVLWLPTDYRPSIYAISSSASLSTPSTVTRIGLGYNSGRVVVIGLLDFGAVIVLETIQEPYSIRSTGL